MKRNKYAATIPAALVNDGTEAQLGNVVRRGGAELLGTRKLKNGSVQVGFSATAAQRRNTGAMLDAYFKNSVEYKNCGADDGVRKGVSKCETTPANPVKEKSKPKVEKPVKRVKMEDEADSGRELPTVQHLYRNYPPLGSDQHKRVVELIGAGCEDPCAYIAGKFGLYRNSLAVVLNRKYPEAKLSYNSTYTQFEPWVRKAFQKNDAELVLNSIWHGNK